MNRYQKAASRPGERRVTRAQVTGLISMSLSADAEERLVAATLLCPCHVRGRVESAWEAVYRLLQDEDRRVRMTAWHTFEDGGLPKDDESLDVLEQLLRQEQDTKVRSFAQNIVGPVLQSRRKIQEARGALTARAPRAQRGKCDFCAGRDVPVRMDLETMIPTGRLPRPALACARCAEVPQQRRT